MTYHELGGCRIVESSAFIAGPLCGMTLAQLGADVIRIDAIGGGIDYRRAPVRDGGRSFYWTGLNKGKRSLALDLRSEEAREIVLRLVGAPGPGGGVLLTNVPSPWLSHKALSSRRGDAISCTIEGSSDGRTAVDYTVNCATGYPSVTGTPERPINHVLPAWDIICANQAALAITVALMRRRQAGAGSEIRLALSDVAFATLSHLGVLAEAELAGRERPALGNHIYGAFGRDFATADGERVMVAAISAKQWTSLTRACLIQDDVRTLETAMGLDFGLEGDRFVAREEIAALIAAWCEKRSLSDIRETFDREGVCWGPYLTPLQLMQRDPRVSLANPMFETTRTPGIGTHLAAGAQIRFASEPRDPTKPAPWVGQHTDEILSGVLGLSNSEIAGLHDRGVVAGPERDPFR
jgi:2-methylfumaryl-CoA isomerase